MKKTMHVSAQCIFSKCVISFRGKVFDTHTHLLLLDDFQMNMKEAEERPGEKLVDEASFGQDDHFSVPSPALWGNT